MTLPEPAAKPASLATVAPIAMAIAVFGVVYGAAAQALFGKWLTLISSVLIFSGTVQFSMVGLLAAGAGPLRRALGRVRGQHQELRPGRSGASPPGRWARPTDACRLVSH